MTDLPPLYYSQRHSLPVLPAPVLHTPGGVPYLQRPGVAVLAVPTVDVTALQGFLDGFDPELHFGAYLDDPTLLPDGTQLAKTAGQACYASYGPKRTQNAEAERYLHDIMESGHGSVLEHPNYSLHVYGVSRSLTHELVRHRAGMAYSQLSQRYVSGRVLRFVERPEFAADPELHEEFIQDIEHANRRYEQTAQKLYERQAQGMGILSAKEKTDLRKKVQQTARAKLPNEAEASLVVTGNVRAWRHIIAMRANPHADTEIRAFAVAVYRVLSSLDPLFFTDMELALHTDGTHIVNVAYPKV